MCKIISVCPECGNKELTLYQEPIFLYPINNGIVDYTKGMLTDTRSEMVCCSECNWETTAYEIEDETVYETDEDGGGNNND